MATIAGILPGRTHQFWTRASALAAVVALMLLRSAPAMAETTLRIGHFPNITHVQALVAHNFSRQGNGWFEQRLGSDIKIEWYVYNAGPSAMEAMFAKSIDLTYVGPNPAINAYAKSDGQEVRIIAGSVNGGSALVVQGVSTLKTAAEFRGKNAHRSGRSPTTLDSWVHALVLSTTNKQKPRSASFGVFPSQVRHITIVLAETRNRAAAAPFAGRRS